MSSHRAPSRQMQPRTRFMIAVVAASALVAGALFVSLSPATATATLNPLELAQVSKANCQVLLAHATSSAQRTRAQKCIDDETTKITWLQGTPTPSASMTSGGPSPTASPTGTTPAPTTTPPATTVPPTTTTAPATTPPATTTPAPTTTPPVGPPSMAFTIAVFLQDPLRERFGQINALNYKAAGINTFVAQWDFPTRADSQARVNAIHAAGLKVWAGGDDGNVTQAATAKSFGVDGYFIGDEQDQNKPDGGCCSSTVFLSQVNAIKTFDTTRPIANNFGKSFSLYPWDGYHCDNGVVTCSGMLAELQRYCSGVDKPSTDFYPGTDPWESPAFHTPRYYGLAIDHMRTICGTSKPLMGFIETGHPFGHGANDIPGCPGCEFGNASWPGMSVDGYITADAMEQGIWSMLAHGANALIYFSHDFVHDYATGKDDLLAEDGMLTHPAVLARATAINAAINGVFRDALTAPRLATGMTVGPSVDATLHANGYIVAAESMGAAGYRSITVAGAAGHTIQVVGENRTLTADAAGTFVDTFTGWGHHVYAVAA